MKHYKYLSLVLLLLLCSGVSAGDIFYVPIPVMAKHAFDIIEGEVTKVEQKWDKDHRLIHTYTTVQIDKLWKNKIKTKRIVIKEVGGQLDGYVTLAPVRPVYRKNEKVMIFLRKDTNYYRTLGLNQGKFNVEIINGKKILTRNINVDELTILDQGIKREDIKRSFKYTDIITIITDYL